MQKMKYQLINISSVLIFSFIAATTINQIIAFNLTPGYAALSKTRPQRRPPSQVERPAEMVSSILDSGFFMVGEPIAVEENNEPAVSAEASQLTLMGTITGPASIARALIKKHGEKEPSVFAVRWISSEINNNVYGYKLIWIGDTKVTLDNNGARFVLDMNAKEEPPASRRGPSTPTGASSVNKSISRAEIRQKVMNNVDEAMKGLVAGPYRKNNKIEGYILRKVSPDNILYTLGARSGDVVKRINGKELNSTAKLYQMWQALPNESKITVDLERRGKLITYDLNITE